MQRPSTRCNSFAIFLPVRRDRKFKYILNGVSYFECNLWMVIQWRYVQGVEIYFCLLIREKETEEARNIEKGWDKRK